MRPKEGISSRLERCGARCLCCSTGAGALASSPSAWALVIRRRAGTTLDALCLAADAARGRAKAGVRRRDRDCIGMWLLADCSRGWGVECRFNTVRSARNKMKKGNATACRDMSKGLERAGGSAPEPRRPPTAFLKEPSEMRIAAASRLVCPAPPRARRQVAVRCSKETEHLFQQRLQSRGWKVPKPASVQVWPAAGAATYRRRYRFTSLHFSLC